MVRDHGVLLCVSRPRNPALPLPLNWNGGTARDISGCWRAAPGSPPGSSASPEDTCTARYRNLARARAGRVCLSLPGQRHTTTTQVIDLGASPTCGCAAARAQQERSDGRSIGAREAAYPSWSVTRGVDARHHFLVRGAGSLQSRGAVLQLAGQVDDLRFDSSIRRLSVSTSSGAPSPDSRQVGPPSNPESFFSSCRILASRRPLRSWALARSACKEALRTSEEAPPATGGWTPPAWTLASRLRCR